MVKHHNYLIWISFTFTGNGHSCYTSLLLLPYSLSIQCAVWRIQRMGSKSGSSSGFTSTVIVNILVDSKGARERIDVTMV